MVAVSDNPDVTDFGGDDVTECGRHTGKLIAGQTVRVNCEDEFVPGKNVYVYLPREDSLSLIEVKVFVVPDDTPAPGEPFGPGGPKGPGGPMGPGGPGGPGGPKGPGGPGGPDGPDGPDGPTEVNILEEETTGSDDGSDKAKDDDPDTCFESKGTNPWWSVNLGKEWDIVAVHILACAEKRMYIILNTKYQIKLRCKLK